MICNHKEFLNTRDCPRCYPKYDAKIEKKIKRLHHEIDRDSDLINARTFVMLGRIKRFNELVYSYGGGVRDDSKDLGIHPPTSLVSPKTDADVLNPCHHAKKPLLKEGNYKATIDKHSCRCGRIHERLSSSKKVKKNIGFKGVRVY
jgi:hypothetical protein